MTKNLKRNGLAAALAVATLFGVRTASAAPLKLTSGDTVKLGYSGGAVGDPYGGGEFLATGVNVANGSSGSFLTFCLEFSEHIALNTNYFVKINDRAVSGGVSTGGTYAGDPNGVVNSYDPLSHATAWLYTQFVNGTLSGFSQANSATHTSLQLAIWKLEGELSNAANSPSLAAYNAYNSVAQLQAQTWVSQAIANSASWTDNGKVRVLNFYDTYNKTTGVFSGNHQDQLYFSPAPEPETYAMLLAGLGLLGFVSRRRKQQAT